MAAKCTECGATLRQYALFKQRCPSCGTAFKAKHAGFTWQGALLGLAGPGAWLGSFFLPVPLWFPLLVVPLLVLAAGFFVALRVQRWVRSGPAAAA